VTKLGNFLAVSILLSANALAQLHTPKQFRFGVSVEINRQHYFNTSDGFTPGKYYTRNDSPKQFRIGLNHKVFERGTLQYSVFLKAIQYGFVPITHQGVVPTLIDHDMGGVGIDLSYRLFSIRHANFNALLGVEAMRDGFTLKPLMLHPTHRGGITAIYEIDATSHDTLSVSNVNEHYPFRVAWNINSGISCDFILTPRFYIFVSSKYHKGLTKIYEGHYDLDLLDWKLNGWIKSCGSHINYAAGCRYNFNFRKGNKFSGFD
jgi:hypothetical protein